MALSKLFVAADQTRIKTGRKGHRHRQHEQAFHCLCVHATLNTFSSAATVKLIYKTAAAHRRACALASGRHGGPGQHLHAECP